MKGRRSANTAADRSPRRSSDTRHSSAGVAGHVRLVVAGRGHPGGKRGPPWGIPADAMAIGAPAMAIGAPAIAIIGYDGGEAAWTG